MPFLRKSRRVLVALAGGFCLLFLVVTFTPLVSWYAQLLAGPWDDPKGDTLIVLGGGTIDETTLAYGSYWRAIYADRVYHEGGFKRVVASGRKVAPLIRDFLVCHGVPANVIEVEADSDTTRENAVNAARMLAGSGGEPVLLTSDYHIFRARRTFEKAGLKVRPRPFPDALKRYKTLSDRWPAFLDLSIETAKIGWYLVHGWI